MTPHLKKLRHECDGVTAFIWNWDKRILSGWSFKINEGDEIVVPMQSGKTAILRVKKIRRCLDPRDQYFADLEDVGYVL